MHNYSAASAAGEYGRGGAACKTILRAYTHTIDGSFLVPKHIVKSRLITLMNYHFVYLMLGRNSEQ